MGLFGRRSKAPPRRKRALLAWEYGAGRTHVSNLLAAAEHLRAAGIDCLASVLDPRFAPEFAALGIPVVQSWIWAGWRRWGQAWEARSDLFATDVLANFGLAAPSEVAGAMAHYDGLMRIFDPDIVLCENAVGACLATRGRVPTILMGFNGLLPSVVDGRIPRVDGAWGEPSWPFETVLGAVSDGLTRSGRLPLDGLVDLFERERVHPFGPALFDLYGPHRTVPVLPTNLPALRPGMMIGDGEETFGYLHPFALDNFQIRAALKQMGASLRLHVPGIDPETLRDLEASHVIVEERPVPFGDIIARSRCVLHHGGTISGTGFLSCGMPQIVLSKEFDNTLVGQHVVSRGCGAHVWHANATADWIADAVARSREADVIELCRSQAHGYAHEFAYDPGRVVANSTFDLLGITERLPLSK